MKKIILICVFFSICFISCNKGCTDEKACNYGNDDEACLYSDEQEEMLTGAWNLLNIYASDGICLFSISTDLECVYDDVLEWVNIGFNSDKTCEFYTGSSNVTDPTPIGQWSINICENKLIFFNPNQGYESYIYPEVLPFGPQKIIELSGNFFVCEDLSGNILRWERI
tara:strand:+ start:238 stop:741 length:504 start_codon:yes stop_codon:yes gene_type:complete